MSKYIIRYKYGSIEKWCYSFGIKNGETFSGRDKNSKSVITMTLIEAREYIKKIKKSRKKGQGGTVKKIEILNKETNEIMDNEKLIPISRFELMEL